MARKRDDRAIAGGAAVLGAAFALAGAAARAAVQVGGATGCLAQVFLFSVMIAGQGPGRRLLARIERAAGRGYE